MTTAPHKKKGLTWMPDTYPRRLAVTLSTAIAVNVLVAVFTGYVLPTALLFFTLTVMHILACRGIEQRGMGVPLAIVFHLGYLCDAFYGTSSIDPSNTLMAAGSVFFTLAIATNDIRQARVLNQKKPPEEVWLVVDGERIKADVRTYKCDECSEIHWRAYAPNDRIRVASHLQMQLPVTGFPFTSGEPMIEEDAIGEKYLMPIPDALR